MTDVIWGWQGHVCLHLLEREMALCREVVESLAVASAFLTHI
jgi:hypothetical protein